MFPVSYSGPNLEIIEQHKKRRKKAKKKINYFVSFYCCNQPSLFSKSRIACTDYTSTKPIKSFAEVNLIAEDIKQRFNFDEVIVINWRRYE